MAENTGLSHLWRLSREICDQSRPKSQDEELQKIDWHTSEDAVPDDKGDPTMDVLLDQEPVIIILN